MGVVGLALHEQIANREEIVPTDDSDWLVDAAIVGDGSFIERRH